MAHKYTPVPSPTEDILLGAIEPRDQVTGAKSQVQDEQPLLDESSHRFSTDSAREVLEEDYLGADDTVQPGGPVSEGTTPEAIPFDWHRAVGARLRALLAAGTAAGGDEAVLSLSGIGETRGIGTSLSRSQSSLEMSAWTAHIGSAATETPASEADANSVAAENTTAPTVVDVQPGRFTLPGDLSDRAALQRLVDEAMSESYARGREHDPGCSDAGCDICAVGFISGILCAIALGTCALST